MKALGVSPLLLLLWASTSHTDDWPMYLHDPCRTGATAEEVEIPTEVLWRFSPPSSHSVTSPVISGNTVLVGASNHTMYALSADTGQLLWEFQTKGDLNSVPCVADGVAFFGSDDRHVYAVSLESGQQLWATKTGGKVRSAPCVVGGTVYVGSEDHNLYALEAATGEAKWTYATGGNIPAAPTLWQDKVLVGSRDHALYCLSADGQLQWTTRGSSDLVHAVPVREGNICVVDAGSGLFVLQIQAGCNQKPTKLGTTVPEHSPVLASDGALLTDREGLHAVSLDKQKGLWRLQTPKGSEECPPLLASKTIYFARAYRIYGYCLQGRTYVCAMDMAGCVTGLAAASGRLFFCDSSPQVGALGGSRREREEGNRRPIAVLVAPSSSHKHERIRVSAIFSRDPEGDALRYEFSGDVGKVVRSGRGWFDTVYSTSGNKTVWVTVTNSRGASDTAETEIQVINRPPVAVIEGPHRVLERENVLLDGRKSFDPDGDRLSFAWLEILGSGALIRRFFAPGEHPVRLKVTCAGNGEAFDEGVILINAVRGRTSLPLGEQGEPPAQPEGR